LTDGAGPWQATSMDLSGEYRIAAPRAQVWAALNDTEVLRACIPGVESLERLSETEFKATVKAKVGPVSARFTGKVTLADLDPPNGYTIAGEGQGGVAGFAKGSAKVRLTDDADGTLLSYNANAQVGGKLAQVGSRLIAGTAKKLADDFFGGFTHRLAPAAPSEPEAAAARPVAAIPAERPALKPAIWILGLLVVVLLLFWLIA